MTYLICSLVAVLPLTQELEKTSLRVNRLAGSLSNMVFKNNLKSFHNSMPLFF